MNYHSCDICPRRCGIDRTELPGRCGAGAKLKIARAALHYWEEPCISGTRGSGTVFFSGLGCVYCQNREISRMGAGKEITVSRLAEIFRELEDKGAHNINLVTPTHFTPSIIEALDLYRPKIPIVYNCGGYESAEALEALRGYVDVYLTDLKYFSPELSQKYSGAADYFSVAFAAARIMTEQTGPPVMEDGLLKRGVIIRHLVLPSHRQDSMAVLAALTKLEKDGFLLSLMSQYTPNGALKDFPEIDRRVTTFEYRSVVDRAVELGLVRGYAQDRRSAKEEYTPPFDLSGV